MVKEVMLFIRPAKDLSFFFVIFGKQVERS